MRLEDADPDFYVQLLNVQVPLIFKDIVDALNVDPGATSTVWVVCGSLVLACW